MKFLHTSDWHLGAKLGEYSRMDEQRAVLKEIRETAAAEETDFIIIAGDVFDNFNPSNEAVELLYRELKKMADGGNRPVIVIAGNHDSPDRIEAPDPLAAECGIFFIGYPDFTRSEIVLENNLRVCFPEKGLVTIDFRGKPQIRILITPYANENRLKKYLDEGNREELLSELLAGNWKRLADTYCDENGINILTAHLFMADSSTALPSEPDEERSILHPGGLELISADLVPGAIQYTALGHLHRPQTVKKGDSPAVYAGSPIAFGLSEENQQKSVVIVEAGPGEPAEYRFVPLCSGRKILRKRFGVIDEATAWLDKNPGCYVELQIECDKYISAADRKRLYQAHDGITAVIPISRADLRQNQDGTEGSNIPDLSESMEKLFKSYFEYAKGVSPDEQIMELFRELTAAGGEE